MTSPYDVSYRGVHLFEASPDELWEELARVERFESWWPWMRDVRLQGEALTPGSVISFRVDPPVPFEMDVRVSVSGASPGAWIEGEVSGDLMGTARLEFEPSGADAVATVSWDVEVANAMFRRAIHVLRPVLVWAQRWAVEIALKGFRDHLATR
ncbi:MAG TPA: hypothetical protein VJ927_05690 [Actinomycetota bacterium]|nr:hypothetical protein [Actinomycetota bacterium]